MNHLSNANEGFVGEPPIEQQADTNDQHALSPSLLIGSLIGPRSVEFLPESIDTAESVRQLETFKRSLDYVRLWYSLPDATPLERALAPLYSPMHSTNSISNQFATKIVPCFMEGDPEVALGRFRDIIPNTIDEEMVLLTNNEQFEDLRRNLADHLLTISDEIEGTVQESLAGIEKSDKEQFDGQVKRSLEFMLKNGIEIRIDPTNAELIMQAAQKAGEGILPITEYVKNEKILEVSGFTGSKISLAVHDFMDHVWTFDLIERAGLLEKYANLFDSIGNPEATDIFKREGEMVASIAFGVRLHQTMPSAFGPLMRSSQIEEALEEHFVAGNLSARHMDAYRTIKEMNRRKGSIEWASLGFAYSNYLTELDEQRRKAGKIKQRDPRTKRLMGELDPLAPDYLCFFIDTHHQLMSSKNKHRNDLFRFHIMLEEYLTCFAKGSIPLDQPLTIKLDELREIDFTTTTLSPQRILWMRNNHGFTATRAAII